MVVALIVGVGVEVGRRVGRAFSVCVMAAETVLATMVSNRPGLTNGAGAGVEALGSPGITQAAIAPKRVSTKKNKRLRFMVLSLVHEIKKPPGYYSREASLNLQNYAGT